jgi:hypothetical protein
MVSCKTYILRYDSQLNFNKHVFITSVGLLANNEMMYGEAVQHFERSLALARQCGNYKESNLDKCHVGIALAKERISNFQKAINGGASFTDATSVLKK